MGAGKQGVESARLSCKRYLHVSNKKLHFIGNVLTFSFTEKIAVVEWLFSVNEIEVLQSI